MITGFLTTRDSQELGRDANADWKKASRGLSALWTWRKEVPLMTFKAICCLNYSSGNYP